MTERRKACLFIWVHPDDCDPPHGLDMTIEYHVNKVARLREAFEKNGFDRAHSALVGYPLNGRIQLLSGTHRHRAAQQAGILLPVTLRLRSDVEATWGTDLWAETIRDIPVNELECAEVPDGPRLPPNTAVNLEEITWRR